MTNEKYNLIATLALCKDEDPVFAAAYKLVCDMANVRDDDHPTYCVFNHSTYAAITNHSVVFASDNIFPNKRYYGSLGLWFDFDPNDRANARDIDERDRTIKLIKNSKYDVMQAVHTLLFEMQDAGDGQISLSYDNLGVQITANMIEFVDIEAGTMIAYFVFKRDEM